MRVNKIEILKIQLRFLQKLYALTPPLLINFTALEQKIDNLKNLSSSEQEKEFNVQYDLICKDFTKKLNHFLKIFLNPAINIETFQKEFDLYVAKISAEKMTTEISVKKAPAMEKNPPSKSSRKTFTPIHEETLESGLEDFENQLSIIMFKKIQSNLATVVTKNGVPFPANIPDPVINEILSHTNTVTLSKTGATSRKLYTLTNNHPLWKKACEEEKITIQSPADSSTIPFEEYKKAYIAHKLEKHKTYFLLSTPNNATPQEFLYNSQYKAVEYFQSFSKLNTFGDKKTAINKLRDWVLRPGRTHYVFEISMKFEILMKKNPSFAETLPLLTKAYSRDEKEFPISPPEAPIEVPKSGFQK